MVNYARKKKWKEARWGEGGEGVQARRRNKKIPQVVSIFTSSVSLCRTSTDSGVLNGNSCKLFVYLYFLFLTSDKVLTHPKDAKDPKQATVAAFFNSDWEFRGAWNLRHIQGANFQKVLRSDAPEISLIAVFPFRNANIKAFKITITWILCSPKNSIPHY